MRRLFLVAAVLSFGCERREWCAYARTECMEVCKDHVQVTHSASLGENQGGKILCLKLCYDEYRICVENGGNP